MTTFLMLVAVATLAVVLFNTFNGRRSIAFQVGTLTFAPYLGRTVLLPLFLTFDYRHDLTGRSAGVGLFVERR